MTKPGLIAGARPLFQSRRTFVSGVPYVYARVCLCREMTRDNYLKAGARQAKFAADAAKRLISVLHRFTFVTKLTAAVYRIIRIRSHRFVSAGRVYRAVRTERIRKTVVTIPIPCDDRRRNRPLHVRARALNAKHQKYFLSAVG